MKTLHLVMEQKIQKGFLAHHWPHLPFRKLVLFAQIYAKSTHPLGARSTSGHQATEGFLAQLQHLALQLRR